MPQTETQYFSLKVRGKTENFSKRPSKSHSQYFNSTFLSHQPANQGQNMTLAIMYAQRLPGVTFMWIASWSKALKMAHANQEVHVIKRCNNLFISSQVKETNGTWKAVLEIVNHPAKNVTGISYIFLPAVSLKMRPNPHGKSHHFLSKCHGKSKLCFRMGNK